MKVITIGRSSENDVVVNDAKVSRVHLQIVRNDSGICSVVDLNSANGTFVNGRKITGEVRLQPQDVIRVGNTTLPWQEYFKSSFESEQKRIDIDTPPSKTSGIWRYIAVCAAVLVLLGGGIGAYFYYEAKEREKTEAAERDQEEMRKEQLRRDAEQKAEEAKRLQDEADELFRQALISQSDKYKEEAENKQKAADKAKKEAEAAAAARQAAERARIAAEKAKAAADQAKETAVRDSEKAIRKAEQKADQAISAANTERDSANEKAELTEKFYEEYAVMKTGFAQQVCRQLHLDSSKDKGDAKAVLKESFNKSDNRGKRAIVDAIEIIRRQNGKTEESEKAEPEPKAPEAAKDTIRTEAKNGRER